MAKPDCDDGWTPIAHELLAAILCAKTTHEARAVLSIVILQIYGPAKRKSATVDPAEVSRMTGIKRPNVWRGVAFLVENGVLERLPDGSFRFVKDYSKWGPPGDRLLTPELGVFSALAPTLARSFRLPVIPDTITDPRHANPETACISQDTVSANTNGSSVSHRIRKPYPTGYANRIPQDTHSPIAENDNEKQASKPVGISSESYPDGSHQECVELALELFGDRQADRITKLKADLAAKLDGSPDPGPGRTAPRWDCFSAALREVKRRLSLPGAKPVNDLVAYALTLATEWAVNGIPDEPVPVAPAARTPQDRPELKRFVPPPID